MRTTSALISIVSMLAACSNHGAGGNAQQPEAAPPSVASSITIDGSSTVFPVSQAIAAEFQKTHSVQVTVSISGTGGGFKKFCKNEVTVLGASRPLNEQEAQLCRTAGVRYLELPIGLDGLSVVVHPSNDWATSMTVKELKRLWAPEAEATIGKWSQIREGWPDKEIHLFGAGADSGTYDYFTAAIVGTQHSSRHDYTSSEDDDVLVRGVAADPLALGFFGYSYYVKNAGSLRLVAIDDENPNNGEGPIAPSAETVANGTYQPLSRPLLIYVSKTASERPEVDEFVRFFLENAAAAMRETGYVPLRDRGYELTQSRFNTGIVGSAFRGEGAQVGVTMDKLPGGK